jgi:hypothetical protein
MKYLEGPGCFVWKPDTYTAPWFHPIDSKIKRGSVRIDAVAASEFWMFLSNYAMMVA